MSKRKVSVEDKIYAVNLYLDGKESQRRIADMFDVSLASVQQWIRNYESMGANTFTLKGNKKYSKELKQQAVLDYLAGYGSQYNSFTTHSYQIIPPIVVMSLLMLSFNLLADGLREALDPKMKSM